MSSPMMVTLIYFESRTIHGKMITKCQLITLFTNLLITKTANNPPTYISLSVFLILDARLASPKQLNSATKVNMLANDVSWWENWDDETWNETATNFVRLKLTLTCWWCCFTCPHWWIHISTAFIGNWKEVSTNNFDFIFPRCWHTTTEHLSKYREIKD